MLERLLEFEDRLTRLEESQQGLIRVGVVVAVNAAKATARVRLDDSAGQGGKAFETAELPILHHWSAANKGYHLPDLDEQVWVAFIPPGLEVGCILGSTYSAKDLPPANDRNKHVMEYPDGTRIEYDRSANRLLVVVAGGMALTAETELVIDTDSFKVYTPDFQGFQIRKP